MNKVKLKEIIDEAIEKGLDSLDLDSITAKDVTHVTLSNIGNLDLDKPTKDELFLEMISYLEDDSNLLNLSFKKVAKLYVDITMRLTVIFTKQHNFYESISLLEKSLFYIDNYSDNEYIVKENKARIYFRIGQANHALNDKENQKVSLIEAYNIINECFDENNNEKPYSLYILIITSLINVTSDIEKIDEYYKEVTSICENNTSYLTQYADMLLSYSNFLISKKNDVIEAVKNLCKCIKILSEFDDEASKTSMSTAYSILSQVFFSYKEYEKSLSYAEESLGILIEISSHSTNICKAMFNVANIAFQGSINDKAEFYFTQLIKYIREIDEIDFTLVKISYNYYGQFLTKINKYEEAIEIYEELLEIINEFEVNIRNKDDYYSLLTEFKYRLFYINYNFLHDFESSMKLLSEVKDSLSKINQLNKQDEAIKNDIDSIEKTNNFNA